MARFVTVVTSEGGRGSTPGAEVILNAEKVLAVMDMRPKQPITRIYIEGLVVPPDKGDANYLSVAATLADVSAALEGIGGERR